jgi:hypothetical protein
VEVPAAGTVECDLRLPQRARLTGRVVAAPEGEPVPRALATLIDADGTVVGSTVSGTDGTFAFDGLPAGSYTLATSGYAPVATVVALEAGRVTHTDVEFGHPLDDATGQPETPAGPAARASSAENTNGQHRVSSEVR